MRLLPVVEQALSLSESDLEGADDQVLRFCASFVEHPLAGLASAVLFDRQSVGLAAERVPRGFVSRRVYDQSMKWVRKMDERRFGLLD